MGQALHSLSALERLGVILVDMEGLVQGEPPVPTTDMMLQCGVPLAHQQGAEGVCTALGSLVQQGRLPALKEVAGVSEHQPSAASYCLAVYGVLGCLERGVLHLHAFLDLA